MSSSCVVCGSRRSVNRIVRRRMRCRDVKSRPIEVFAKSVPKGKKQVAWKRRFCGVQGTREGNLRGQGRRKGKRPRGKREEGSA